MKRLFYLPFILLLSITLFSGKAAAQADFMMQGWYWDYPKTVEGANWADTLRQKTSEIGQAGFNFLWLPPLSRTSSGPWSNGYDPKDLFDYGEFGQGATGFGTRNDLDQLISALDAQNIKAVADLVYNHRDGGGVEDNPGLKNYIVNFYTEEKAGAGANPFPYDRMRVVLPLGGASGNGAGDYYFKFRSRSQHSRFHNWEYQIYMWTDVVGWQGIVDPINESEPNNGGDCGTPNNYNVIELGRNIHGNIDSDPCGIDEFQLTLTEDDFNATGDAIYIEFNGRNSGYSDLYIHGIWYEPADLSPGENIVDDLYYQTFTNFNWVPSGRGKMDWSYFKPNLDRETYLEGDWDGMYFYYDYDQFQSQTRDSLFAWTRWNWSDVGIRGLRVDAVKHFPEEFMGNLLNHLHANNMNPPMVVGEWYGTSTDELAGWVNDVYDHMNESAKQSVVPRIFDFSLREALRQACDQFGYDVRNVFGASIVDQGKLNGLNVVTFANNHDFRDQSGYASLIHNDAILAYAYILTNNQIGASTVFYPDYFGYPAEGQLGHKDYHPSNKAPLKNQINRLMEIHNDYIYGASDRIYLNNFSGGRPNSLGADNQNVLVYQLTGASRDVIVAINFSGDQIGFSQQIDNVAMGTHLEDLTGNAIHKTPVVENANGVNNSIWISLPKRSYAVYRPGSWGLWNDDRSNADFNVKGVSTPRTFWDDGVGNIQGYDFGTFKGGDIFELTSFDIKTWKKSGADVTGGNLYYTIYPKGQRPASPVFQNQALGWIENIGETGDQKWGFSGQPINLLDGLAAGEYTVEFYAEMNGADPNKSEFDSNNGANYIAHFRYNYVRSANDGDWNLAATWLDEVIPDNVTMSAEVNHDIILAESQSLYDLILLDGSLTLNPGVQLTVTNTLSSELPASGLLLQSSSTGTASLIHHTANVQATVQRYVSGGWGAWDEGWHLISSPVAGQAIAGFTTTGAGNDYDFYGWNESANTWMNYKADGFYSWNGSENFNPVQGYLISYEQTQEGKAFAGTLNINDITLTDITFTPGAGAGWHLMGNPYASALRWNDGNWALSNVAGTAKIWHSENKSYSDIAPNSIIPSAQGFMIQVNSADNSITIPETSRLHSDDDWYKSTGSGILLIAREADGSGAQESRIRLNEQATAGYDFYHDSRFLPGYAPQFYSIADGIPLSTSVLPEITDETEIEFGFIKNSGDDFIIELAENIPGLSPLLIDKKLDVAHDLHKNPVYSFTSEQGDEPVRFLLKFGQVGIHETANNSALRAYYRDNRLMVITDQPALLALYDVTGRLLKTRHIAGAGQTDVPFNFPTGMYIVNLTSRSASTAVKVIVP